MPMVALGVFILFFGWIGFNGGSAPFGVHTGPIVLNTVLGGVFGGLTCLLAGWATRGISGASTSLNGVLAGLVAITAGADVVSGSGAALIGCGGGLAYLAVDALMLRLRLDDAVSAVPVHAGAGAAGVVLTALFVGEDYLAGIGDGVSRLGFVGIQAQGVAVCCVWGFAMGWLLWTVIGWLFPLRGSADDEAVGLNYSEHRLRSPMEEAAAYLVARAAGKDTVARPGSGSDSGSGSGSGEAERVIAAAEAWATKLEQATEELERVRAWLRTDSERVYQVIQRCDHENRLQSQRLELVMQRVDHLGVDLRQRAQAQTAVSPLACDVLDTVADGLRAMRSGSGNLDYYWDQLRNLGSALFRNTRTLSGAPLPDIAPEAGAKTVVLTGSRT
jgi:Amt family ammonium transporter